MSATDRLRAMLDERGVERTKPSGLNSRFADSMTFIGDVAIVSEIDGSDLLRINFDGTPEQAIAATLGAGTCKNKATSLRTFWCDCCDCALEDWMDVGGKLVNGLRYCPNCGRKVE